MYVFLSVLYLLVKVLLQAVLQHCIKGRGGLGLELKAHNGTHLQGGVVEGRGCKGCEREVEGETGDGGGGGRVLMHLVWEE